MAEVCHDRARPAPEQLLPDHVPVQTPKLKKPSQLSDSLSPHWAVFKAPHHTEHRMHHITRAVRLDADKLMPPATDLRPGVQTGRPRSRGTPPPPGQQPERQGTFHQRNRRVGTGTDRPQQHPRGGGEPAESFPRPAAPSPTKAKPRQGSGSSQRACCSPAHRPQQARPAGGAPSSMEALGGRWAPGRVSKGPSVLKIRQLRTGLSLPP